MPTRNPIRAVILALILAFLAITPDRAPASAHAQTPSQPKPRSLDIVGHLIGGRVRAVALEGGRIYAGVGRRLVIMDASRLEPTRLGETGLLPGEPVDIHVAGNLAYVATTDDGALAVVDIADPHRPSTLSTMRIEGEVGGVAVAGGYAYVAGWASDFLGQIWALDLRDPTAPNITGTYQRPPGSDWTWVPDIAIAGRYAFASLGDVVVLDLADPGQPREVATFGLKAEAAGIAVAGGRAFVPVATGDIDHGLLVFDVAPPDQPKLVTSAALARIPLGIVLRGGRAYVGLSYLDTFGCGTGPDDFGRVQVFDLSNPDAPRAVGLATLPGDANAVAAEAPERMLVATGDAGLLRVDVGAGPIDGVARLVPEALADINSLASKGDHVFLAEKEDYAFAGTIYKHHLIAVDVRDPTQPRRVAQIEINRYVDDPLVAAKGVIYNLNSPAQALELIDVRDPAHMRPIARLPLGDYPHALALGDGIAFVALRKEIVVVDVRAPAAPLEITRFLAFGSPRALAVDGGTLFVRLDTGEQNSRRELLAIDVRDPGHPRELSRLVLSDPEGITDALAAGDGLVVLDGRVVVDARDPTLLHPWLRLGQDYEFTRAAIIRDHRLYTATAGCLRAFDLTVPGTPAEIAVISDPNVTRWVAAMGAAGDRLYLATSAGGFLVAQLGAAAVAPPAQCGVAVWLPARDAVEAYLPLVLTRRR